MLTRLEAVRDLRAKVEERRSHRARLVRILRSEGYLGVDAGTGSLLSAMAAAGVFRLGFYTLGALAVRASRGPQTWQRARVPDVPVIYLRAVAVREDMQGKGLGATLMIDAMRRCLAIAEQMGAAAIVLDALADDHFERRSRFYAELGFRSLGDPDNRHRLFIPMVDVRANLG